MTLSEGWDLSGSIPGAFRTPRFEELDITNMLLRQRPHRLLGIPGSPSLSFFP
ncbi:hypothetical protein B296_00000564 [Ensete ventricosum]|uniref:Uncharacterized protein n=1 Tax=Ensete ventricosum TaxID=4639 RepID=A0A427A7D9_ENSVE|nr:hypothetical protein B296_00000564 [Ensete ventricosum]